MILLYLIAGKFGYNQIKTQVWREIIIILSPNQSWTVNDRFALICFTNLGAKYANTVDVMTAYSCIDNANYLYPSRFFSSQSFEKFLSSCKFFWAHCNIPLQILVNIKTLNYPRNLKMNNPRKKAVVRQRETDRGCGTQRGERGEEMQITISHTVIQLKFC